LETSRALRDWVLICNLLNLELNLDTGLNIYGIFIFINICQLNTVKLVYICTHAHNGYDSGSVMVVSDTDPGNLSEGHVEIPSKFRELTGDIRVLDIGGSSQILNI
jgi:hypothetical protein